MLDCMGSQKNAMGKQTGESSTSHLPSVKPKPQVPDASGINNERLDKKPKNVENGKCGVMRSVVTISAVKMSAKMDEEDSNAYSEPVDVEPVLVRAQAKDVAAEEAFEEEKLASSKTTPASDINVAKQKYVIAGSSAAPSETGATKCSRTETSVMASSSSGAVEQLQLASGLGSWAPFEFLDITNNQQVRVGVRVGVPISDHPHVNFIGKLLGPKGNTLKRLQQVCGTRIAILGRGSMKDAREEERCRSSGLPKYAHLHYDTHVLVEAVGAPADAYEAIASTLRALEPYISPLAALRTNDTNPQRQAVTGEARNPKQVQTSALAASVSSAANPTATSNSGGSSPATPSERPRRYLQCPNYGCASTSNSSATKTTTTNSGCGESPRASPGTCYAGTSASTASASGNRPPTPSSTASGCTMQMQQTSPSAYVTAVGYEPLADSNAAAGSFHTASYQATIAYQSGWSTSSPSTYVSTCETTPMASSATANATAGSSTGVNTTSATAGAQQRNARAPSGATSNSSTATARRFGAVRSNTASVSRGVNSPSCAAQEGSNTTAATANAQRKAAANSCESLTPREPLYQQQQQLLAQQSFAAYAPPLMLKPVNYANAFAYPSATGSFAQLNAGMYAQGAVGYAHPSVGYFAAPSGANTLAQAPLQQSFTPGSYSQQATTANAYAHPNAVAYLQMGSHGGLTQQATALAVGSAYSISAKVAEYEAYLYNQLAAHYVRDPHTVTAMISYWSALYAQALQDEYCTTSPSGTTESTSNSMANGNTYCSITYQQQQYAAPTLSTLTPDTDVQMATSNGSDSTGAAGSSPSPPDGRVGTPTTCTSSPGSAWLSQSPCPQFTMSGSNANASAATWR